MTACEHWTSCPAGHRAGGFDLLRLGEPLPGPWCDDTGWEAGWASGRCSVAPLRPEEEKRLRDAYGNRDPFWERDWKVLALLSTIDAARRERDEARGLLAAEERAGEAYRAGFLFAHQHPGEHDPGAKQRGVYPGDQDARIEWERGFMHQRCAAALVEDTGAMIAAGIEGPACTDPGAVILRLIAERGAFRDAARCKAPCCSRAAMFCDLCSDGSFAADALRAVQRDRDEARALLAQQASLEAVAERIDRNAIERCVTLGERVAALEAERDALRAAAVALIEAHRLHYSANPDDWGRGKQDESAALAKLMDLCP